MKRISIYGFVVLASLALVSCQREKEEELEDAVRFSVDAVEAADSVCMAPTRTSFGGVSGGNRSMTWSSGDRVSIYSPDAMVISGSTVTHPAISYNVSTANTSSSHVSPVSTTHLLWGTGSTQAFYGKYPDPAWSSSAPYSASTNFKSQTAASNSFTCYLPPILTFTPATGTYTYAQNMTYCYMTAYTTASRNASSVTLPFTPDVTTFRITVPHSYVAGVPVTSVTLSSASHRLNGEFTVSIGSSHSYTVSESSLSAADKSVVVYFTTPVTIPSGSSLQVTLFTCPVDASDLTLSITTFDGNVLTLPLKNSGGSWLSFTRCRFYNITCGSMPEVDPSYYDMASISNVSVSGEAVLNNTEHTVTVNTEKDKVSGYGGADRESHKTPWKAYYSSVQPSVGTSVAGNSNYSTTPPSWIQVISGGNGAGKDDAFKFRVTAAEVSDSQMNPGPSAQAMINKLKAHEMSTGTYGGATGCLLPSVNPLDGSLLSGIETANCYIVNGYGTFYIPLVYGPILRMGDWTDQRLKSGPYTWTSAAESNDYLRDFVNADGNPIGEPLITGDPNLDKTLPYNGCVVWQDTQKGFEIVKDSDISIIHPDVSEGFSNGPFLYIELQSGERLHYLKFTIRKENIKPGNVVLALRDANNKILWSWHIWVRANITSSDCSSVKNNDAHRLHVENVTYLRERGNVGKTATIGLLSEPLGWTPPISYSGSVNARNWYVSIVSTETNKVLGFFRVSSEYYNLSTYTSEGLYSAPYYQWGRKDPFIGSSGKSRNKVVTSEHYTIVQDSQNVPHGGFEDSYKKNLGHRIQFPYVFNDYWADNPHYCNLWDGDITASTPDPFTTIPIPMRVLKTVYDPCPPGFNVPMPNVFTGITYDGWGKQDAGSIYGIFEGRYSANSYNNEYPCGMRITTSHSSSPSTFKLFLPALGWRSWVDGLLIYHYDYVDSGSHGTDDMVYLWTSRRGTARPDAFNQSRGIAVWQGSSFMATYGHTSAGGFDFMTDGFMIVPQRSLFDGYEGDIVISN